MKRALAVGGFFVLLLSACNLPQAPIPTSTPTSPPAAEPPSPTNTAEIVAPPTEEEGNEANLGQVSGIACYPSEFIPPMTLYFLETGSQQLTSQDHDEGVQPYSLSLPAGSYVAYAYRKGTDLAGSYSAAVSCGFGPECTDHSLLEFEVVAGSSVEGIDICDWVAAAGSVPTEVQGPQIALPATATPPPGGVSLECDGTYQRVRLVDSDEGRSVVVDNWQAGGWVTVWTRTPEDPFLQQIQDSAGWYEFQGCQKLVVVPIRHGNPHVFFELGIYRWNGATMTQVYANEGAYGEWSKAGDVITFRSSNSLGTVNGGPLGPCKWVTLEHEWDGDSFDQVGSLVEPVEGCVETVPG